MITIAKEYVDSLLFATPAVKGAIGHIVSVSPVMDHVFPKYYS